MNTHTENIGRSVLERIRNVEPGAIIFSEDFKYLHKADAVNMALARAAKLKLVWRISKGIYMKPKKGLLFSKVPPKAEEVANAIARRDRLRILPSGSHALYKLGLTDQIPTNIVYLTDGAPRKFKVGSRKIQFKKTSPKILSMKGEISSLVVQALKEIGKNNLSESDQTRIRSVLRQEDPEIIEYDLALAPQWIGELIAEMIH